MPRNFGVPFLLGLLGSSLFAQPSGAPSVTTPLIRVAREQLCVTNGVVSTLSTGELGIETPSSRAVVRIPSTQVAEIRFRYLGPTSSSKPLASGELRRQVGLKLRAQDTCNLLYAMWHIEPDTKVSVSIKRNPGKHTHEQCDAHGYINITPRQTRAVPRVVPGGAHRFRAELQGTELAVFADGGLAWQGSVGKEVFDFEGPVGFRTDNARFALSYWVGALSGQAPTSLRRGEDCRSTPGD
jgi:hypothetical protein